MKKKLVLLNQSVLFFDLLMVLIIFVLSICLANYLGAAVNFAGFLLGWLSACLLLIALQLMDFYGLPERQLDDDHRLFSRVFPGLLSANNAKGAGSQYRGLILLLIFLGGWAILQYVMLQLHMLPVSALWLLALTMIVVLLAGMPAAGSIRNGYRELLQALLIFGVFPAYAYTSTAGEFHILILLISFPMAFFYLSWRIAHSLFRYADDQRNGKSNLLQRLGWKRGMTVHNLFILISFVLYACIPIAGYPSNIFLNAILSFPLGLLLIVMMFRIERGKKPEWQSVMVLEKISILLMAYFLAAAMILR